MLSFRKNKFEVPYHIRRCTILFSSSENDLFDAEESVWTEYLMAYSGLAILTLGVASRTANLVTIILTMERSLGKVHRSSSTHHQANNSLFTDPASATIIRRRRAGPHVMD